MGRKMRGKRQRRRAGFTLIELSIAIVVVGLLSTVAILGINGLTGELGCRVLGLGPTTAAAAYYSNTGGEYPQTFNQLAARRCATRPAGMSETATQTGKGWVLTLQPGATPDQRTTFSGLLCPGKRSTDVANGRRRSLRERAGGVPTGGNWNAGPTQGAGLHPDRVARRHRGGGHLDRCGDRGHQRADQQGQQRGLQHVGRRGRPRRPVDYANTGTYAGDFDVFDGVARTRRSRWRAASLLNGPDDEQRHEVGQR